MLALCSHPDRGNRGAIDPNTIRVARVPVSHARKRVDHGWVVISVTVLEPREGHTARGGLLNMEGRMRSALRAGTCNEERPQEMQSSDRIFDVQTASLQR
jgi:hypothetical protein